MELAGAARPRAFVATGEALDPEMNERIARHRASRSSDWITAEVPVELARWFADNNMRYQCVLVDCLTLWLSNIGQPRGFESVTEKVAQLLKAMRTSSARVVVVSNELGMGLVPVGKAVRQFRDVAGKVNQQVAAEADEVYFVVSGQSLRIK